MAPHLIPWLSSVSEQQTRHNFAARIAIRSPSEMLTKKYPLSFLACTSCLQRGFEPNRQTRREVPRHVRCVQESHTAQALCLRRNDTVFSDLALLGLLGEYLLHRGSSPVVIVLQYRGPLNQILETRARDHVTVVFVSKAVISVRCAHSWRPAFQMPKWR